MSYNNCPVNGSKNISEYFSKYFPSVYINNLITSDPSYHCSSNSSNISAEVYLHSCLLSITDVLNGFEVITNNTTPKPDMISNIFFTECKFILINPLLYAINLSFSSCCFPSYWKISFVTTITKGNDLTNMINYRPISLIFIIPKILEYIVYKNIYMQGHFISSLTWLFLSPPLFTLSIHFSLVFNIAMRILSMISNLVTII